MTTHVSATLIEGMLKPDETIPLPGLSRVRLTVEPIEETPTKTTAQGALEAIKARLRERPIHGGSVRYTRDDLHERR
jgi:hypothetical protein